MRGVYTLVVSIMVKASMHYVPIPMCHTGILLRIPAVVVLVYSSLHVFVTQHLNPSTHLPISPSVHLSISPDSGRGDGKGCGSMVT